MYGHFPYFFTPPSVLLWVSVFILRGRLECIVVTAYVDITPTVLP